VPASSCEAPRYPQDLRESGLSGRVLISFVIDTTGHAERNSIEVVSSTHPGFINPAIQAVLSCTYRPGVVAGVKVPVRVTQPVNFSVERL
jgi:TonB family protein